MTKPARKPELRVTENAENPIRKETGNKTLSAVTITCRKAIKCKMEANKGLVISSVD